MSFEKFLEDARRQIDSLVAKGSWMVSAVVPAVGDPEPHLVFAYTIGLTEKGYPELFIAGLSVEIMHDVLNETAALVSDGEILEAGSCSDRIFRNMPAWLLAAPPERLSEHSGLAHDRYGEGGFSALQIFWPDAQKRFPWQANCSIVAIDRQCPLFGVGYHAPVSSSERLH